MALTYREIDIAETVTITAALLGRPVGDVVVNELLKRYCEYAINTQTVFAKPRDIDKVLEALSGCLKDEHGDVPSEQELIDIHQSILSELRLELRGLERLNPWGVYTCTVKNTHLRTEYLGDYRIIAWGNSEDAKTNFSKLSESLLGYEEQTSAFFSRSYTASVRDNPF